MNCLVILPKLKLHRQTMTAAIFLKVFTESFFLLKTYIEMCYIIVKKSLTQPSLIISIHTRRQNIQKTCMGHFDPLRRSRRLKFSAVLVLNCRLNVEIVQGFNAIVSHKSYKKRGRHLSPNHFKLRTIIRSVYLLKVFHIELSLHPPLWVVNPKDEKKKI